MKRIRFTFLWLIALISLTACSGIGSSTLDYSLVDVVLSSEPSTVHSGKEVTLIASFSGVPEVAGTEVTFDIKLGGKSKLVEAEDEGKGVFKAPYTFSSAGTYYVYIHLYQKGEHITKLKRFEVL